MTYKRYANKGAIPSDIGTHDTYLFGVAYLLPWDTEIGPFLAERLSMDDFATVIGKVKQAAATGVLREPLADNADYVAAQWKVLDEALGRELLAVVKGEA